MNTINSYASFLRDLLPSQFRDGENWLKLLNVIGDSLDTREADVQTLLSARTSIDDADGILLDHWGLLFGLARGGKSDAVYRTRIAAWMQALVSKGTPDELISIARELSGGDAVVYWETPPATFNLELPGPIHSVDPELSAEVDRFINKARPLGTAIGQLIDRVDDAARFDVALVGFDLGNFATQMKGVS